MAMMMMLPIGKTVTTTRMMWPQAVKVSASSCSAQPSFALQCAQTNTWQKSGRAGVLRFFQHKNFCSKRVCRVPEHWPQDRKYPRASASTTLLLQFHSGGFNFDVLYIIYVYVVNESIGINIQYPNIQISKYPQASASTTLLVLVLLQPPSCSSSTPLDSILICCVCVWLRCGGWEQ